MKIGLVCFSWAFLYSAADCHILQLLNKRKYSGHITPHNPKICNGQYITFKCQLLNETIPGSNLHFARTFSSNDYTPFNESDVVRENKTTASLTMRAFVEHPLELMHVKCYYGKQEDVDNNTLIIDHPIYFEVHTMPVPVKDFQCILEHYEVMNCSWKFGQENVIDTHINVTFEWKPSESKVWNQCKELLDDNTQCIWPHTYHNETLYIRIISEHQHCNATLISNHTINPALSVRPNPVHDLSSQTINSSCVQIQWSTDGKRRHKYTITQDSIWNTTEKVISDPHDGDTVNVTLCGLEEHTRYRFTVKQQPQHDGFSSNGEVTESTTLQEVPSASPAVLERGYFWDTKDCTDGKTRHVCLTWKSIKPIDRNGDMIGIDVNLKPVGVKEPATNRTFDENTTYGCVSLQCDVSYIVSVRARNEMGTSKRASIIHVEKWKPNLQHSTFKIEVSDVLYVSYKNLLEPVSDVYLVWCVQSGGHCKEDGAVSWTHVTLNEPINTVPSAVDDYLFSVSASYNGVSYGSYWEHCIYTKNTAPTEAPRNVIVTTGSEDSTLVVTWNKLRCKSGQPYIVSYRVKYCHVQSSKCSVKTVPSYVSRVILDDLIDDEEYTVYLQGVASNDREGPYSKPVSGTPVHYSLKVHTIVGITFGGLILMALGSLGCVIGIRLMRRRFIQWKTKVGAIRIPEYIGLDLRRLSVANSKKSTQTTA